mgnify:CR=1 FL=1
MFLRRIEIGAVLDHRRAVRKIEKAMGDGQKQIIDLEMPIAKKLRLHLKWEASEK